MAWVVDPSTMHAGTAGHPGHVGSLCPSSWTEDFDRAQMSTQVLINHATPTDVPVFRYNFPGSFANPPPSATICLNAPQTTATVMRVHKTDGNGDNIAVWLRYVQEECGVTIKSVARSDPDKRNITRGYRVTGTPTEQANHFDIPVTWIAGTQAIDPGFVDLTLQIVGETPLIYQDTFGVNHYGRLTFTRTDLIRTEPVADPVYETLADRILEIRGSNSVPRLESVTIDARTGPDWYPIRNMNMMSLAAPEKPSRYYLGLTVNGRPILQRMCFATSVRHFIARDEWTLRVGLDVAEWAAQL